MRLVKHIIETIAVEETTTMRNIFYCQQWKRRTTPKPHHILVVLNSKATKLTSFVWKKAEFSYEHFMEAAANYFYVIPIWSFITYYSDIKYEATTLLRQTANITLLYSNTTTLLHLNENDSWKSIKPFHTNTSNDLSSLWQGDRLKTDRKIVLLYLWNLQK